LTQACLSLINKVEKKNKRAGKAWHQRIHKNWQGVCGANVKKSVRYKHEFILVFVSTGGEMQRSPSAKAHIKKLRGFKLFS